MGIQSLPKSESVSIEFRLKSFLMWHHILKAGCLPKRPYLELKWANSKRNKWAWPISRDSPAIQKLIQGGLID